MRKICIILLWFFSTMVSCKKENPYDISGKYQLTTATPLVISKHKLPITISAANLYDCRCPEDVMCIWAGYASIEITFKTAQEEKTITLCTGEGCNITSIALNDTVVLNGVSYEVKLDGIEGIKINSPF